MKKVSYTDRKKKVFYTVTGKFKSAEKCSLPEFFIILEIYI